MKLVNKMSKLLIFIIALTIPIQTTLAYYTSSDNIKNTLSTLKYSIKINVDNGSITDNIKVKDNKVILPDIEKDNYTFLGYATSQDGNVVYNANDEVSALDINNKTLYAKYEVKVKKVNAIDKIKELANTDTNNLIKDDGTSDHNIRYIGSDPNNYVKFSSNDTDKWRIVGLFNNVEDKNGNKGQRLKLVREASIGKLAWDNDEEEYNNGFGLNEWSDADLMKLLNPNFDNYSNSTYSSCSWDSDLFKMVCNKTSDNQKVNNSLWWNSQKGLCYDYPYNVVHECDFTGGEYKGPSEQAKSMIDDVVWKIGGIPDEWYDDETGTVNHLYNYERGTNAYDCSLEDKRKCPRTTSWTGKVALIYPSDYGYATKGGTNTSRGQCLSMTINHWHSNYDVDDCFNNNYLYTGSRYLLSPFTLDDEDVFTIASRGYVAVAPASFVDPIYPAVFLKQNVSIVGGTGTSGDPYIFG